MGLREMFPPLYECSVCGASVEVRALGPGLEPEKRFSCVGHETATIYANRKATCRGVGTVVSRPDRLKLFLRQFLSALLKRSV